MSNFDDKNFADTVFVCFADKVRNIIRLKNFLFVVFFLGICGIHAQTAPKIEIADGTIQLTGKPVYSTEAETVFRQVQNSKIKLSDFQGLACGEYDTFRIIDSAEGFFTSADIRSKVYLYSDCDTSKNRKIQGVIVLQNEKRLKHFAYNYSADVKIVAIKDLNENSIEELAIYSNERIEKDYRKSFRMVEFQPQGLKKLGGFELQNDKNILFAFRIFAEKSELPKFFASKFQTDGYKWKNVEFEKPVELAEDKTVYSEDKSGRGILRHFVFSTFVLQGLAFIGLFGLLIGEMFFTSNETAEEKQPKLARKEGKTSPIIEDNLPKLTPINCRNCGAGVPLQIGEMICPNCGTKTNAPENYFDVAQKRDEINDKIRNALKYLKRAKVLSSGWTQFAILLLAVWLTVSMITIFVLVNKGNFDPYQSLFSKFVFTSFLTKAASFTNLFWIFSLLFAFLIWSPRIRKTLPSVELNDKIGESETANCSQCGGAIFYQPNDLASVCGYCGVETYRAKLAWKLRNLTNNLGESANFSLLEAKRSVANSLEEITGMPKVLLFLLVLAVIMIGGFYLFGAVLDLLPDSVKEIFAIIAEILNSF